MSQMKTRRELGLLATGVVIATGLVAGAKPARAERQPDMVRARESLNNALEFLRAASDDKGGHKVRAIQLIEDAIRQVNAGIEFANTH
jgi:hypothetical protein